MKVLDNGGLVELPQGVSLYEKSLEFVVHALD